MQYFVYAIKSLIEDYVYVGHTSDLETRLKAHNAGKTKSNRSFRPYKIFYFERCNSLPESINREKELKSGYNREILRSIAYKHGEVPKWFKGAHC